MLSVLAELQRELIVANTRDGLAAARARGRKGGRPPKLSGDRIVLAQQLYYAGEKTVAQIAAMLNVPRTTVYGHLNKRTPAASASTDSVSTVAAVPVVPARTSRICPSCGYEPSTRAEAAHQRGDLAVIWLHPHIRAHGKPQRCNKSRRHRVGAGDNAHSQVAEGGHRQPLLLDWRSKMFGR